MNPTILEALKDIIGEDWIITDNDSKQSYLYDEMELNERPVANLNSVVVKPSGAEEISQIMKLATIHRIPVVVRGGGTGLCGGAIPVYESIVLSMERLNKVLEIDEKNMMAVLEAGVTLAALLETLKKYKGLSFPVHPGDEAAHMGGMAATNAGGARAVRHGIMRNHIKGLEVVLPNGEILKLGGKLLKDNAGYSLMHLIMGSEGTLAVITKVILRLYPEERATATVAATFGDISNASKAVLDLLKSGVSPLAVEYQDKHLNLKSAAHLGLHWPLQDKGRADLMVMLSEKDEETLFKSCAVIDKIFEKYSAEKCVFAGTAVEEAELLAIRSGSYEVIKDIIVHSFDMAVPPGDMPEFLEALWVLVATYGTSTNITAHIADGNVHHDIILVDGRIPDYYGELKTKMYELCFRFGGTITGEHGVGKHRVADLGLQKPSAELALMRQIKQVFDPDGILNPDTVVSSGGRELE